MPEKIQDALLRLNSFRYFLFEGGRGGGKTQGIGRFLIYLSEKKNLRVVCGRETQNSIAESVYSLFCDVIRMYQLDFQIFASKIVSNVSGSTINFRGFREQGAFNIQGMEGVDVVWIDEAQALTKQTLDVLIPTIRKDNAKIIFSLNRHVIDDPVYKFVGRDDCLHVHINYDENKFCTQALKNEADECRKISEDDYKHIWLGQPLAQSENAVFGHDELEEASKNVYPLREAYGMKLGGFDIARFGDDKSACVGIQQMGALHWRECLTDQWGKTDLNFTTGRILSLTQEHGFERSIIDEDGLGGGPLDSLSIGRGMDNFVGFRNTQNSFKDDPFYANKRTAAAFKLKDLLLKGHIQITDPELIKELLTIRYTFDHYQRRILISKQIMKDKYKVKSPNLADALFYAVSLIGEVHEEQEAQYQQYPQQTREENLFGLAGVR